MATLCDFCLADALDVSEPPPVLKVEPVLVSLNGAAYELDACERHRKPLDELAAWLAEHVPLAPLGTLSEPPLAPSPPSVATRAAKPAARPTSAPKRRGRPPLDRSLVCPSCKGKPMANRQSLAAHARNVHKTTLGELEGRPTPFECPECPKRFTTNSGLVLHASVHKPASNS